MSIESAQTFLERMKTDEEFAKNVTECKDSEARMSYVKEAGFDFTLDEVKTVTNELTDDMLDQVAGGTGWCGGSPSRDDMQREAFLMG
ncbi:MAG: Nif11-like leader peptide family natural product precursor [Desulfuromonadaceae bacterium]|nr:Nif11-like leader peptide family natural product precursor [Desulfuromonadaceae bacterium]